MGGGRERWMCLLHTCLVLVTIIIIFIEQKFECYCLPHVHNNPSFVEANFLVLFMFMCLTLDP